MNKTGEFEIPEEAFDRIRDPDLLKRYMDGGKTFQEILGYSDLAMEGFYRAAYRLLKIERFEDAVESFVFLTTLNPHAPAYWMGLAMSEQLLGKFEKALIAYGLAVNMDPTNPILHYHSAACYRELGESTKALAALETAIACAEESEEHQELAKHCERLLKKI